MMEDPEFETFMSKLQRPLGSALYSRSVDGSLLLMDFTSRALSFVLDNEDGICGMWKVVLTKATMTDHFENECNIYEESGLASLAGLFSVALQGDIRAERLQSNNMLALQLEYDLGSKIIGALKLQPVQMDLSREVLDVMKALATQSRLQSTTSACKKRQKEVVVYYTVS